jgi:hypothetical protein
MWRLLLLLSVLVLVGCPAKIPPVVEIAPGQYQIPVQHDKIDVPAGWEDSKAVEEIVVPSRADGKPTTLHIKPKKKSLLDKAFPPRNDTAFDVVSDNKDTSAKQRPAMPWWWKALMAVAGLGALWMLGRQFLGPIPHIVGQAFTLIARIFRRSKP